MRIKAKIANKSAAVPKLYTGGWISVKERLPDEELAEYKEKYGGEKELEVLVMIEGAKEPTVLSYDGEEFHYYDGKVYPVGCWQPLPLPPITAKTLLDFNEVD